MNNYKNYGMVISLYSVLLCALGLASSGLYYFFSIPMYKEILLESLLGGALLFVFYAIGLIIIIGIPIIIILVLPRKKPQQTITNPYQLKQMSLSNVTTFGEYVKKTRLWIIMLLPIIAIPIFFLNAWYGIHVHPFSKQDIFMLTAGSIAGVVGVLGLLPAIIYLSFKKDGTQKQNLSQGEDKSDENSKNNHTV
jgi:hypothetical protein